MGTNLQEVYDSFFIKTEGVDFTYKQDMVYQYFMAAIGYSYKTIPTDLAFTLNNDVVLIITKVAITSGNVTIKINTNSYSIPVLTTDTLIGISNKIKAAVSADYTVEFDHTNTYPFLTVTKSDGSSITASFVDTDQTSVETIISRTYTGSFDNVLFYDAIQLIALFMKQEYYRKVVAGLEGVKQYLGTKDFNKLPDVSSEYKAAIAGLKEINDEIFSFRQEFYQYNG